MLGRLICKIFNHRVLRRRVWNDGLEFRATCSRCGAQLVRDPSGWREYVPAQDDDPQRLPHPRDRTE